MTNQTSPAPMASTPASVVVTVGTTTIEFELNDSAAARSLLAQLPFEVTVEDYSTNEKVFHPSKALETTGTPLLESAVPGTLAYFEPWNNVVLYYGDAGPYGGLYLLGQVTAGAEHIGSLSGVITVRAA